MLREALLPSAFSSVPSLQLAKTGFPPGKGIRAGRQVSLSPPIRHAAQKVAKGMLETGRSDASTSFARPLMHEGGFGDQPPPAELSCPSSSFTSRRLLSHFLPLSQLYQNPSSVGCGCLHLTRLLRIGQDRDWQGAPLDWMLYTGRELD